MARQSRKQIRMVGSGVSITGCLIRRVTKYSESQDACVIYSSPVLPYRKTLSSLKQEEVRNSPHLSLAAV